MVRLIISLFLVGSLIFSYQCGEKKYCSQMDSCEEAMFYYKHCGLKYLDGDGDGVPCENLCRSFSLPKISYHKIETPSSGGSGESFLEKIAPYLLPLGIGLLVVANLWKWVIGPGRRRKRYRRMEISYTEPLITSKPVKPSYQSLSKKEIIWNELKKIKANEVYLLKGNTYPFKEELKTLGGKWKPEEKAWEFPGEKVKEFLSNHLKELSFLRVENGKIDVKIRS